MKFEPPDHINVILKIHHSIMAIKPTENTVYKIDAKTSHRRTTSE